MSISMVWMAQCQGVQTPQGQSRQRPAVASRLPRWPLLAWGDVSRETRTGNGAAQPRLSVRRGCSEAAQHYSHKGWIINLVKFCRKGKFIWGKVWCFLVPGVCPLCHGALVDCSGESCFSNGRCCILVHPTCVQDGEMGGWNANSRLFLVAHVEITGWGMALNLPSSECHSQTQSMHVSLS